MTGSKKQEEKGKCFTCKSKDCYGSAGGNPKHKQKLTTKWIECDTCQQWFHGICQGLQVEDVAIISNLEEKGVRWHCDGCIPALTSPTPITETATLKKLHQLEHMIDALDEKVSNHRVETAANSEKITKSWAEITGENTGELAKEVKKAVNLSATTQAMISKEMERKDNESRLHNAILYGVPERDEPVMKQIDELMRRELFKDHNKPLQAIRLGNKTEDKPRPIKLRFNNEKDKWEFLKRANSGLRGENFFCKLDLSKQSRDREFSLRSKIRTLREENPDNNIMYRIRNEKIQSKTKDMGEWQDLTTVSKRNTSL